MTTVIFVLHRDTETTLTSTSNVSQSAAQLLGQTKPEYFPVVRVPQFQPLHGGDGYSHNQQMVGGACSQSNNKSVSQSIVLNVSQFLQMPVKLMWGPNPRGGGQRIMESNLKMKVSQTHCPGPVLWPSVNICKWARLRDASDIQVGIVSRLLWDAPSARSIRELEKNLPLLANSGLYYYRVLQRWG